MQTIYIFDFDGVVTNAYDNFMLDERVLNRIAQLLIDGNYVAFNTGRGRYWFDVWIGPAMQAAGVLPEHLDRFALATEKGGMFTEYISGKQKSVLSSISLSKETIAQARHMLDESGLTKNIHWSVHKDAMVTVSNEVDANIDEFRRDKAKLDDIFFRAFADNPDVVVESNHNATDLQSPKAGKDAGAKLIHDWVMQRLPEQDCLFACFGDAPSDYEMARHLAVQGNKVQFIFTGPSLDGVTLDPRIEVITPEGMFNEATYNYFTHASQN